MNGGTTINAEPSRRLKTKRAVGVLAATIAALLPALVTGQTRDWPFAKPSPTAGVASTGRYQSAPLNSTPPPLGATMRQKTWNALSNQDVSLLGGQALGMNPRSWFHGETEDFIIHYRNFSDALQVAREIEFDLWYVARTLGAAKEQYARKSHVYVFQDEKEWQAFVALAHERPWSHSFALRDELFLNVHGTGSGFESHTLAHETTHAVVARIYGNRRWPLWLNEGFADYMADACAAVRRGLPPAANPPNHRSATLSLTELIAISRYPEDQLSVSQLYETGAKFVRYLFTKYRPELFVQFVNRLLDNIPPQTGLVEVYGEEFRDLAAFDKRFAASR